MAAATDDATSFAHALARRINTRLVVFVPTRRDPRWLWTGRPGGSGEVEALAAIGRAWLVEHERHTSAPPADGVARVGDEQTVLAPAWSEHGVSGAVVARKEPGVAWSAAELALVRFTIDYYAPLLERWASRAMPGPGVAHDGPPAGDLGMAIRDATRNGELFLRYQPEVDLQTKEVAALEALVRWEHPQLGELGPEAFISIAERSDVIRTLGAWVVNESLREFAAIRSKHADRCLSLRVNVSPVQIAGDLVSVFADALVTHDVPGEQVCVEITENVVTRDTGLLAATLQALKRLGITSAIDDLASGYSSLTRLRDLPVDIVKIDRAMVSGIDVDSRAQRIVAALLRLSDDLGVRAVAEGVETESEAAMLRQLGCKHAQGHLFGRPMTADETQHFLSLN